MHAPGWSCFPQRNNSDRAGAVRIRSGGSCPHGWNASTETVGYPNPRPFGYSNTRAHRDSIRGTFR